MDADDRALPGPMTVPYDADVAVADPLPSVPNALAHLDLEVTGMTCASCATRIEKKLNKLDGVEATVNFALERARVTFDPTQADPEQLLGTIEAAGYGASLPQAAEPAEVSDAGGVDDSPELVEMRQRLVVCAALSIPVVVLAMVPPLQFDNWQWMALTLASPVAVWGAWPFHVAAWKNARHRTTTMDTLVSVGVIAAYAWSLVALFFGTAGDPVTDSMAGMTGMAGMGSSLIDASAGGLSHTYLEVAAAVPTVILLGRYFELRTRRRTGAAVTALLSLGAKDVALIDADGTERRVPVEELTVGDTFVVRPGERIATDGEVLEGTSAVDTSLLTGESVPVDVGPGDAVVGATICDSGRLVVRATRVGSDTQLARIARLVEDAQTGKAEVQRLADRVAGVFVPVVIVVALLTLLVWTLLGDAGRGFVAAVSVLVIACPCALGLATPMALMMGTGRGAQLGILIRGPEVLESTRRVDTVVLDKTGTVTTGRMELVDVVAADGEDRDATLRTAGALESASEHPIARAVAQAAAELGAVPAVDGFQNHAGRGVTGTVDGVLVAAGRPAFVVEQVGASSNDPLVGRVDGLTAQGASVVAVGWDGAVRALLAVADTPRPTSAEAVERLRALGLEPVLLTGDQTAPAQSVAAAVGIGTVISEVLPEDKVAEVVRLQESGKVVAMVGDGVNDAAALATADLGIAMGTGTDAAIEAADLTLVGGDLRTAADAIRLSRRTLGTIKGNLFWAFAYNVAAVPVAAMGWLNPMLAGVAMAASSLFVVSNSLRLKRFRPT